MKPAKLLLFVMLFAMACSEKEENPGDFGEIQIPDVGQLDQTIGLEGTEKPASITFRTADAWTSTIVQTRADAPDWISISPDHGDQAGSYTIQIDVKPNDTGAERSAVVSIRCNNSEVNVSVTQEFEEPSMRTTLGRLARITEYENDKIESVAVFSYDEEERILSVITYLDADLSQKAESWEFSYPPYNSSKVTVTETHYDKTQAYGYVWECEGGFTTPSRSFIQYATATSLLNSSEVRQFSFYYDANGFKQVEKSFYQDGGIIPDYEGLDIYSYETEDNCSKIQRTILDQQGQPKEEVVTQLFSYDERVSKYDAGLDYEQLFLLGRSSATSFDPSLYVITEPDMLRFLGFCGNESRLLPSKVTTSWSNGNSVTETLSYRYGNRSGWQIGEQIDGMEIVVKSSDSGEKRYVLTFDGM